VNLAGASYQSAEHHCGGTGIVEGGVRGGDVDTELLDKASQPGSLSLG
jgi:hypothetical protein